jgi:phage shock protein A
MIRDEAVKANEVLGGELGEIMQAIKELKQELNQKTDLEQEVRQEREDSDQVERLKQELLNEITELKQEIEELKELKESIKTDEDIAKLAIGSVVQHLTECEECRKKIGLVVEENDGGELGEEREGNEGRKVGIFWYPS